MGKNYKMLIRCREFKSASRLEGSDKQFMLTVEQIQKTNITEKRSQ
jgi:hypothetical protein